jgi:hypothetical protein
LTYAYTIITSCGELIYQNTYDQAWFQIYHSFSKEDLPSPISLFCLYHIQALIKIDQASRRGEKNAQNLVKAGQNKH